MQIFHYISILIPLALLFMLPRFLPSSEAKYRPLLYIACALFFISWYLPSPLIDGQDTSFITHLIGGGVFTGFLWLYLKYSYTWQHYWTIEAFSLFALVSALGCTNELAELAMVRTGIAQILLTDTSWDILANTIGSLLVYTVYVGVGKQSRLNENARER